MGNANTTIQTVDNIVANYTEVNAEATALAECKQTVTVKNATLENCNGGTIGAQTCKARANATIDVMTQALMEAELDAEAEQYVEGLALAMNVNVNSSNIKQEVINKLKAQCEVTATTNPEQIYEFEGIKCINSDWPLPEVRQYGDATADCLVKQLVQNSLDAEAKTKVTQKNIGLNPAAVAASCLLPILVFGGIGFVFSRKGGANKKNFNNRPFRPPSATGPNARNGMYNFGTNGRK